MCNTLDFEEVYSWLNWHREYQSFLSVPMERLIEHMKTALLHMDYPAVEHYISLSMEVCESLGNSLEIGETCFECAFAYLQMGELSRSIPFLRQSINLFTADNVHNRAVALWMLGFVFWEIGRQSEAIVLWERSCRIYRNLIIRNTNSDWYANASKRMCGTLRVVIDERTGLNPL
jgi:tetratricopeptide (TPR) repeat protein